MRIVIFKIIIKNKIPKSKKGDREKANLIRFILLFYCNSSFFVKSSFQHFLHVFKILIFPIICANL